MGDYLNIIINVRFPMLLRRALARSYNNNSCLSTSICTL